jgi:hypothetical protein
MRRIVFAALLSLPALALAAQDASAFFSICGDCKLKFNFCLPRIVFGFDWGCPPACCPHPPAHPIHHLDQMAACVAPWYASPPPPGTAAAAAAQHHAFRAMPTAPTRHNPPSGVTQTGYGYYYGSPQPTVPAYWYSR